ncbi:hybrid sensor histidine kinase/response regulator [Dyadobacter sp. CY323]|uniref:hybrid sensor histidine kinase/response regulator n=1 Tax=Dyadobacter sp. CY323 TaxID=2907302 RepID=UPI001F2D6805|nr:ATP-binding protein [Dyadobacter sp. CY323]MCE6992299.1 ATP-binding protein [Dyadobacter sp. CY323]
MSTLRDQSFLKSVKGKVLLGFFVAFTAIGASWIITNYAFNGMLENLSSLSNPDDKLRLVNKIFKNILLLDHLQNARKVKGEEHNEQLFEQSAELMATLDSLKMLSLEDPHQIIRIDSMKKIILAREKIYGNYVKVRTKLVNNKALEDEVKSISGLITTTKKKPDSTVVKTEKRTTTTTVYTETPDSIQKAREKKGFFNRVFGNSKKAKKVVPAEPTKVVQKQEVNIQVDTITVAQEDSAIEKVGEAVQAIEKSQKIRTTSFIDREQELATAGNSLVKQLLDVMQEVEGEVLKQSDQEGLQTQNIANQSREYLKYVMLGVSILIASLLYLIFTDIAKSNQYRAELEDAKEEAEYHSMAKQRFLSNMSHEIRTPLQSIIGYTEALKKDEKPKKQDLETLHSASEHLLYLVNEVLDYSRIISDRFTFENRVFAMNPLLTEVVQVLRPTAVAKGLVLRLENSLPANLYLNGDPFRLRQILYNLLTNAIKFTENGEVVLKVHGVDFGNEIQLEYHITDTGIGLTPDQVQKIFNQFEQADSSISRRYGGTGLGLSIVKALVEGMGGTVKIKSIPGQGTTFSVSSTMKKAEALELAEETPERSYNITGKVWLVDDDAFILKWCSSVLQMNGIPHTSFSSAEEVLSRPGDNQVRFVLTDMRMSGMTGAEMVKRLRKNVPDHVKFFVLTAQALPEERNNLLNMGFDGYLMKPFHSKELLELLESSSVPTKSVSPPAPTAEIDFTSLNEMTFGDESLMREILDQFVMDSRKDIDALQIHLENRELHIVQELMHRLAGRIGQIGAKELSIRFRNFEIALRDDPSQVSVAEMWEVVENAKMTIEQVEERALAYSI